LCEAGCGLEITVRDAPSKPSAVVRIGGDRADVFSHGYICPKGSTLKQLHEDPDRLRSPMLKRDGVHVAVSWDESREAVHAGLNGVIDRHGRSSLASYLGNPGAHSMSALLYNRPLLQALGSHNRFSASTVDQMPKQIASGYLFGTGVSVAVPDLDRTDYLLMLGANPYASNGSMCTAPGFPGRLEAIRERGGKLVVVDPRRSRTAESGDEWLAIRLAPTPYFCSASPTRCSSKVSSIPASTSRRFSTVSMTSDRRCSHSHPSSSIDGAGSTPQQSVGSAGSLRPRQRQRCTDESARRRRCSPRRRRG